MSLLSKVNEAEARGVLPASVAKKIRVRARFIAEAVNRAERSSGIEYPAHLIEPVAFLAEGLEQEDLGILYARTLPVLTPGGGLEIRVGFSAPLVLFALKSTINAVVAHELLHYFELARRFITMDILSEQASESLLEGVYADYERTVDPSFLIKDRYLLRLLKKKFGEGLEDERLHIRTLNEWIKKGLPTVKIEMEENVLRIPVEAVLATNFSQRLRNKVEEVRRLVRKKGVRRVRGSRR